MASEQASVEAPAAIEKYSKRVVLETLLGRSDGGVGLIGQRVVIGGWVKSSREFRKEPVFPAPEVVGSKDASCVEVLQTRLPFFRSILKVLGIGELRIHDKLDSVVPKPPQASISILLISDGSCVPSLQVLVDSALAPPSIVMPTGTCIHAEGILQKPSLQGKQILEFKAETILYIGEVDHNRYPLSKKRVPLESLRDLSHFRPRTTTVASVMRIRNALTQATHKFLLENGFLNVQVPIITRTDCEGFSENFLVTTLLGNAGTEDQSSAGDTWGVKLESIKASIKEKSKKIEELQRTESNKEALASATHDHKKATELASQLEEKLKAKIGKPMQTVKVDFSKDFFSSKTILTVSGRLHLESYACALGNVYSFGPRFRANKNYSNKSLSEMWIAELEMAFSQIEDSMDCANDFLKFICKWILENCTEDLKFIAKRVDKSVVDRLQFIVTSPFEKVSYTEAVDALKKVTEKKFGEKVEWGALLSEEHKSYLTEEIYKKPLVIYNQPKELEPFYVRLNDDGRTVASFETIVPKVGTLIRGSQKEERLNMLNTRIKELGLDNQQYEWYLDLHKHGVARCSGFSFLLDPLVLYATGLNDARDAVPFPRSFGKANN
ncbi:asparagine--tRNA ligase, cytoplasmic 2-like [Dorcoceras hygrometricum]|uniref:Asparagine--tRNA ligase, cytoplasmic 2-like n=1 Tax=Dorcoceras hygrometricum TaxID=472368 RepID=A0A2Z7B754_9LAMI|nr:asparagine--tRNA ligase, cytoplasmic 2-like [Dorcoceras hygrometricum]